MMKMITKVLTESLDNIWPMLTIFLVVVTVVRVASLRCNNEKLVFYKEFTNLLFIVYILLLFELLTNVELNNYSAVNLVPFTEILRYDVGSSMFYYSVIGNIVIFIPFGYLISTYIKPKRVLPILLVSIISSTTVEFVQYCIGRSFDIDDIILNVTGAFIGFLCYVALNAIRKYLPGIFGRDIIYNLVCLIILIVLLVFLLGKMGVNIF